MILGFIVGMGLVLALIALYFAPTIVAVVRKHRNIPAIATVNALLGWTFVGWVIALVWSVTNQSKV